MVVVSVQFACIDCLRDSRLTSLGIGGNEAGSFDLAHRSSLGHQSQKHQQTQS